MLSDGYLRDDPQLSVPGVIAAWRSAGKGRISPAALRALAMEGVMEALRLTGWSLDLEHKEIIEEGDSAIFINHDCRVQKTRVSKGLDVFACKPVRFGYLAQFVKEIDPEVEVTCELCPPDELEEGTWCRWRFSNPKVT